MIDESVPTVMITVKDMWGRSRVTRSGAELLQSGRELTTKVGEQPWPQLVRCVLGHWFTHKANDP